MVQSRTIEVPVYHIATGVKSLATGVQRRVAEELAGYPRGWPLVLSTIRYFVLLAAGEKFEDDFLRSVQSRFAAVFSGGQNQPTAGNDFVGTAFG